MRVLSLSTKISRYLTFTLGLGLTLTASQPKQADAVDITMYILATHHGSEASMYKTMMITAKDSDERRTNQLLYDSARRKSTGFLIAGLALDALALVIIASMGTGYDQIERLQVEVENGGGPMIDAYAAGFGLSQEEVIAHMKRSLGAYANASVAGAQSVDVNLLQRLAWRVQLSDDEAGRVLYALYTERSQLSSGQTPWHDRLAFFSGVPIGRLAQSIAAPIDERLQRAAIVGTVNSARSLLAQEAAETLQAVVDNIYTHHAATIAREMNSLSNAGVASNR